MLCDCVAQVIGLLRNGLRAVTNRVSLLVRTPEHRPRRAKVAGHGRKLLEGDGTTLVLVGFHEGATRLLDGRRRWPRHEPWRFQPSVQGLRFRV